MNRDQVKAKAEASFLGCDNVRIEVGAPVMVLTVDVATWERVQFQFEPNCPEKLVDEAIRQAKEFYRKKTGAE